jgi:hypothetical protein
MWPGDVRLEEERMSDRSGTRARTVFQEAVAFGSVYVAVAFISLRVKLFLTPAWFDGTLESNHSRLLAFSYANNEQSRLLQFAIPEAFHRLFGLSIIDAYILQRWLFVSLVFLCFHHYLRKWFDARVAFAGVLFFAAIMPLTYFNDLQESTPLLLSTFLLALWAIREQRLGWYVLVLTLGAFNNETMLILPLVFVLYTLESSKLSHLGRLATTTAVTSLPAFLVVGAIRYITRDSPRLAPFWQWPDNLTYLSLQIRESPLNYWRSAYVYIFFIFGMFWLYAILAHRGKPRFLRRAAWMIPVFILAHFVGGMISEVRLMLPLGFVVIPLALFYLFPEPRAEEP